ncbi:hypothetical protein M3Y94_00393000 [Aphelenchoides besseyi]|nr:hypothetical protein M3Y94_00393000 [Aphelenchoides besseyi]
MLSDTFEFGHMMKTRSTKRTTESDVVLAPPAKTVCVRTTPKPQLRRSIVLETFIRFIVENQIVDERAKNYRTKNYTFTFVNRDFALCFRKLLFQLHRNGDLDLTSRIVCTNDNRCTITNLFGFGSRMRSQVVRVLSHSFLPLFGCVVVKSLEDAEFSLPTISYENSQSKSPPIPSNFFWIFSPTYRTSFQIVIKLK